MTFTYQFEAADWIAFSIHHLKNSRVHQRRRFWGRFRFLFVYVVLAVIAFFELDEGWASVIPFFISGFAVFLAYPTYYDWWVRRAIRKQVRDPDNVGRFAQQTMTLSPEGVRLSQPGMETMVAWESILRIAETSDHLFLYISAMEAIIIPHRSLEGVSFDAVRAELRECTRSSVWAG